jgi:hypothetical protein
MSTDPRYTQFQGFAKALLNELTGYEYSACEQIIARRAYDLVRHTVLSLSARHFQCLQDREIVASVPDMTAWAESGIERSDCNGKTFKGYESRYAAQQEQSECWRQVEACNEERR